MSQQALTVDQRRDKTLADLKTDIRRLLDPSQMEIPIGVTVEGFLNAFTIAAVVNPDILGCDPRSIYKACRELVSRGLVPDGREAALVPFKRECTAMPMVYGLIKTMRNSGEVGSVRTGLIYQTEYETGRFRYVKGDEETLFHEPIIFGDRGELVGAYAVVTYLDPQRDPEREVMTIEEIEHVRLTSPQQRKGRSGVWQSHYTEMVKKTVVRRISKRLPMSPSDLRKLQSEPTDAPMRDVTPQPQQPERPAQIKAQEQSTKNTSSDTNIEESATSASGGTVIDHEPRDAGRDLNEPSSVQDNAPTKRDGDNGETESQTDAEETDAEETDGISEIWQSRVNDIERAVASETSVDGLEDIKMLFGDVIDSAKVESEAAYDQIVDLFKARSAELKVD